MGISIHYKGKLNNTTLLQPFIDEIEDISKDMNWDYNLFENDITLPNTSKIENGIISGHLPLRGISINIHPKAESLYFYFDKNGNLRNLISACLSKEDEIKPNSTSIKTQFAPIEIHITIINLLKYIKSKFISNFEVNDEGEFWETDDILLLRQKFDYLNSALNKVAGLIDEMQIRYNETPDAILARLMEVLKRLNN
ncbi:MAG: hypothetical protein KKF62_11485 [Bacteroidetes bacterium]|nr:hypothetical protein [Bacteroidota bacterium]MBU1116101.1 hypothetical protein [Bacteroidota bacterium]MBU1799475.1 hypothetical protein [Bacteroidota bacterium]